MPYETPEKPLSEQNLEELTETAARLKIAHLKLLQKSDLITTELIERIRNGKST
jgi:hypothetical protein